MFSDIYGVWLNALNRLCLGHTDYHSHKLNPSSSEGTIAQATPRAFLLATPRALLVTTHPTLLKTTLPLLETTLPLHSFSVLYQHPSPPSPNQVSLTTASYLSALPAIQAFRTLIPTMLQC
jgi:hypothetical protein